MFSVYFSSNAFCFIILMYLVPVLFTFNMQSVLKVKKKNYSGAKRLTDCSYTLNVFTVQYF